MRISKLPLFEEKILQLFDSGKNIAEICREIGSKFPNGVKKILLSNNKILKGRYVSRIVKNPHRIHDLDLYFFKKIDSHEKAYWLGYITADGYVQKNGYRLVLSSKDKEIIEKFKFSIKSSHPLSFYSHFDKRTNKTYDRWYIQINSKSLIQDLYNIGVSHKKSNNCIFPKIDEKYYPDYLRGLFDGDGSIFYRHKKNRLSCNLIATEEILFFLQEFLYNKFGVFKSKLSTVKNNIKKWKPSKYCEAKIFLDYIYKESSKNIRLSRKYDLYYQYYYSKISYLFWDIDGTLVSNSPELHHLALNNALKSIDEKYCIQDNEFDKYNGLPTKTKLNIITKEKGLPEEFHQKIWQEKQKTTIEMIKKNVCPDAQLIKLFKILKRKGYRMGVYTNCIKETAGMFIQQLGIKDFIEILICNEDVEKPKPHGCGYDKLVNFFGAKPKECLVVEDTKKGKLAAIDAHCNYLLVDGPKDLYNIDRFIYCLRNKLIDRRIKFFLPYEKYFLAIEDILGYTNCKDIKELKSKISRDGKDIRDLLKSNLSSSL